MGRTLKIKGKCPDYRKERPFPPWSSPVHFLAATLALTTKSAMKLHHLSLVFLASTVFSALEASAFDGFSGDRPPMLGAQEFVLAQDSPANPGEKPTLAAPEAVIQALVHSNQRYLAAQQGTQSLVQGLQGVVQNQEPLSEEAIADSVALWMSFQEALKILDLETNVWAGSGETMPWGETFSTDLTTAQAIAQDFGATLALLTPDLGPEAVESLQRKLDFFTARNLPEEDYGFYGPTTQEELELFLDGEGEKLQGHLLSLNQGITETQQDTVESYLALLPPAIALTPTDSDPLRSLQDQYEELRNSQKTIFQRITSLRILVFLLPVVAMVLAVMFMVLMIRALWARLQEPQDKERGYQLTVNDLQAITEEVADYLQRSPKARPQIKSQASAPAPQASPPKVAPVSPTTPQIATALDPAIAQDEIIESSEPIFSLEEEEDLNADELGIDLSQFANDYDELVSQYNLKPQAIAAAGFNRLGTVAGKAAKGDLEELHHGVSFRADPQGAFYLVPLEGVYYLIPTEKLAVSVARFKEFYQVFNCYGDPPSSEGDRQTCTFKLLKPARLDPGEQEYTWALLQKGIVEFD